MSKGGLSPNGREFVDRNRERMRGQIALALILLLTAVLLLAFLGLLAGRLAVSDLRELLILLVPLIGLVSTAVRFYFERKK